MSKKQKFKQIIFSQDVIKKSRYLACIFTPAILCIVILQYFYIIPSRNFILKSNIIIFFISVFLIIKPKFILLWVLIGFIAFFINIFDGGNLLGLSFYLASILILLKYGFFRTKSIFKILAFLIFFMVPFIFQYKNFGVSSLKLSIFNIIISFMIFIAVFLFFAVDLKKYFEKKETYSISELNFTERQYNCFILAIRGFNFKQISKKLCVSESVIKKEMTKIYKMIDVKNYTEFLVFVEKYEIID